MSGPRTKRPFAGAASDPSQRQITSFFTTRPGPAPADPSPAPIPSEVQSNLLSVGMRVRKSVPEGYKTGSYSSFKLWQDGPVARPTTTTTHKPHTHRTNVASQRELLPFCGINKVGGLASQPAPARDDSDYDDSDVPGLDDMPGLSSSQESVESSASDAGGARSRKRFFDDGDDDGDEPVRMWTDRAAWLEGEVSPRSLAPSGWANARTLAVPRKSRRGKAGAGQENVLVMADDFEDADFLVTPDTDMSDA